MVHNFLRSDLILCKQSKTSSLTLKFTKLISDVHIQIFYIEKNQMIYFFN